MKRLLTTLLSILFICCSALQAQEIRQLIISKYGRHYGFTLYENDSLTHYHPGRSIQQINGIEYYINSDGRYGYRQDGNKIYCYTVAEEKETLVMDFGLAVGDTFALYDGLNVKVEEVSDTLLPYGRRGNQQISCKKILVRGIELPDFTDMWIEDVGSLHYGLNPPKAGDTRLIYTCRYISNYYLDKYEYQFDFRIDDVRGVYVPLEKRVGEDVFGSHEAYLDACDDKYLTFDLRGDTLCIGGYIAAWCDRKPYLLIEEGTQDIQITSIDYYVGFQQTCTSVYPIDLKIPGFTREKYTVHYKKRVCQVSRDGSSALEPIALDSKEWNIKTTVPNADDGFVSDVHMWIEGDTVVDGMTCRKLYTQRTPRWEEGEETLEVGYCHQDGDRYYQNGRLMFDLGLQVGDTFYVSDDHMEAGFGYIVTNVGDTVLQYYDTERRYVTISPINDLQYSDIWLEGIGSLTMGILDNDFYYSIGMMKELLSCSYGGEVFYDAERKCRQFVDTYYDQMVYVGGSSSYYGMSGTQTIDGIEYVKENGGRYCYRQDKNKIYCYDLAGGKEHLVMDFGLEVGETFTLYDGFNVKVEEITDTLLSCWGSQQISRKKMLLRGVEQPDFTDTWIEGIGSMRYGLNPPTPKEARLLYCTVHIEEGNLSGEDFFIEGDGSSYTFIFEYQEENLYFMWVRFGAEVTEEHFSGHDGYMAAFYNNRLEFSLHNDTLHIGGYIGSYCEGGQYFLIIENGKNIRVSSMKHPGFPDADCISVNRIDADFPGFTQDSYTVNFAGRTYQISRDGTSLTTVELKGKDTPYYDLQGRPVANPTRGIYIKDGKKIAVDSRI